MVDPDSGSPNIGFLATAPQASGFSTANILLLGIVLVALVIVIGAMGAAVSTLLSMVRELVALVLVQLGRLLLIGLCLLCLIISLMAQPTGAAAPCGRSVSGTVPAQTCDVRTTG